MSELRSNGQRWRVSALVGAALLVVVETTPGQSGGGAGNGERAGEVTQVHGQVTVASPDGNIARVRKGLGIDAGATINTAPGSFAKIKFNDGGSIFLRPSTRFRIDAFENSGGRNRSERNFFSLVKGGLRFVTGLVAKRNRNAYRIRTPTATIGIRGTDAGAQICDDNCIAPNGLHVLVFDGVVITTTPSGQVVTPAGKASYVGGDGTPRDADPADSPISEDMFPRPDGQAFASDCAP